MGIRFACFTCNEPLNVKQDLAGKRGKCPRCGERFRVPVKDQATADPLEAEPVPTATTPASPVAIPSTIPSTAPSTIPSTAPLPVPPPDPLAEAPTACWYVRPTSGGQYGPATAEVMRQWLQEQRIGAGALLWREGWATWRAATEIFPQLAVLAASSGLASPVAAAISGAKSNDLGAPLPQTDEVKEGLAKRKRLLSQRRMLIIAALIVVSIALIVGLIAVVTWK